MYNELSIEELSRWEAISKSRGHASKPPFSDAILIAIENSPADTGRQCVPVKFRNTQSLPYLPS
jgi:hypothetical protein